MRRGGIFNSFIITRKGSHICNIHYTEKLQIHIKTDKIHIKADKSTNMQPLMLWMCASLHLFISFTGSTANTTFATHEHIIRELIICFIVRLLLNPKVKEFWKSVNIRRSYGQEYGVLLFWHTGYLLPVASDCQTMELLVCACVCHSPVMPFPRGSLAAGIGHARRWHAADYTRTAVSRGLKTWAGTGGSSPPITDSTCNPQVLPIVVGVGGRCRRLSEAQHREFSKIYSLSPI